MREPDGNGIGGRGETVELAEDEETEEEGAEEEVDDEDELTEEDEELTEEDEEEDGCFFAWPLLRLVVFAAANTGGGVPGVNLSPLFCPPGLADDFDGEFCFAAF